MFPQFLRRSLGFTLIELMVVVAIMAILAAISTPYILDWIDATKLRSGVSAVTTHLALARSEAIKYPKSTPTSLSITTGAAWIVDTVEAKTACDSNCTMTAASATSLAFTRRGILEPLTEVTLTLQSGKGTKQVQIKVSQLGTVSTCSPSAKPMGGYAVCQP